MKWVTGIRWGEVPRANGFEIGGAVCVVGVWLVMGGHLVLWLVGQNWSALGWLGEFVSFTPCPILAAAMVLGLLGHWRRGVQMRWPAEGRCARCGYDLSALREVRACPECGYGVRP